jgi:hypothetical protein
MRMRYECSSLPAVTTHDRVSLNRKFMRIEISLAIPS